MANYSVKHSKTATLVANTVDVVTLTDNYERVEVLNLDGVAEIWLLVDGTTNPGVNQDDMDMIPAGLAGIILPTTPDGDSIVRLVSTGTPRYHVRGLRVVDNA